MGVATIISIIGQLNTIIPAVNSLQSAVHGLFMGATADLSNAERIELLRQAGVMTVEEADAFLNAHRATP